MARIITFNTIGNIDKSLAGDNALGQLRDFPGIGLSNGITEGTGAIAYNDNGSSIGVTFLALTPPSTHSEWTSPRVKLLLYRLVGLLAWGLILFSSSA